MELRKLVSLTLTDQLRGMEVGETCLSPDNTTAATVRRLCAALRAEGLMFSTSTRTGKQTVTRLQ